MVTDPWAAREEGIKAYHESLSQSALDKYNKPKEAWKNVVAGHQKAVAGSLTADEEKQFKQDRRDWNRLYKSTPVGIMASGVNLDDDPFGAQTLYHDMSAHLGHDAPKLMDRMYPLSRGAGKIFSAAIENIGPLSWLKKILPKREPKVPANVLAMRDRFPGADHLGFRGSIDEIIPPVGIAPLIPEHIRRKTIFDLTNEDEGIFYGGRGELSPDFDYEEEREGRELSLKRAFLKSINPYIDYDSMPSEFIETFYEDELNKQKIVPEIKLKPERDEIIPQIEEPKKNNLPFHTIRSMPGNI